MRTYVIKFVDKDGSIKTAYVGAETTQQAIATFEAQTFLPRACIKTMIRTY